MFPCDGAEIGVTDEVVEIIEPAVGIFDRPYQLSAPPRAVDGRRIYPPAVPGRLLHGTPSVDRPREQARCKAQ